ncbi:MAG: hypothetical protein DRJ07_02055 [Bacteroidetes bacterium]|nr:MAG: hypothetical protein DRJ07_02055 [Bacteroidota bacterium]
MGKIYFNRVTAILLLVFLLTPVFIQLIHATEDHTYREMFSDDLNHIQHIENDCAVYHHQINHNAIDLHFDFEIGLFSGLNQDIRIIFTETKQNHTNHNSSRAPPVSFV